ncbi:hypothetical protein [Marichromatium bheemlicum]|uniref:DUF4253 domain-containing protein n=1 Tax=Marichromatium bheemlicum TaxID=365339 RepID=A0ABX1IAY3_9GAMM|nr:hypothetical protein [Marichromatium bheemlicum]NKN34174.1 hypothetical protein [Marichromatium bheemlicum]
MTMIANTSVRPPVGELEQAIARVCRDWSPGGGVAALSERLQAMFPGQPLRHVLTRGGWYRLGGVIDLEGRRVAEQVRPWAEAAFAAAGGDLERLLDGLPLGRLFVTRVEGRTHYLSVATGPAPEAAIQIELEELREVLERPLTDPDWYPEGLAEFVDPTDFPRLEPEPVAPPRLVLRRVLRLQPLLARTGYGCGLPRFLADWIRSSAAEQVQFCHHWIVAVRDEDGHDRARPVAATGTPDVSLQWVDGVRGAALANRLHAFDRSQGYPFAWYFHMLSDPRVSHRLAAAVHADLMGAYAYLPARDLRILRDWCREPYGV